MPNVIQENKSKLFGTDGVRGVANVFPMTVEVAMQLGRALAYLIRNGPHRHRVIIGKDTRLSGYMLEQALAVGIMSMGVDVEMVGPLPTPAVAMLTVSMRSDAGAVISASHNPYQDNGIKFFWRDGFKLPDETEATIESLMFDKSLDSLRPTAVKVGGALRIDDAPGRYIAHVKASFPRELTLEGFTLVLDCAHGAAYKVSPAVLKELGARVITLGAQPDGQNINHKCGALHPQNLQKAVLKHRAHLGIALDGDGDRLIVIDETGRVVNGDAIMAICTGELAERKLLKKKTLVSTVMSNGGLEHAVARWGVRVVRTKVGDRYVVEEMRRQNYNLGGEQSGHLVFMDHATTGDGTLAALQLLAVMARKSRSLSELAGIFDEVPQVLLNCRIKSKCNVIGLRSVSRIIRSIKDKLGKNGRVFVRYSGTEPLIRILVEGPDAYAIKQYAREICDAILKQE